MARIDPHTKESFLPRRSNQKFASSQNRIRHNNNKANLNRKKKAFCDRPLHINYTILTELMQGKKSEVFHSEFLKGKGFSPCITHIEEYEGQRQFCVYEYIVIYQESQKVKIVRK